MPNKKKAGETTDTPVDRAKVEKKPRRNDQPLTFDEGLVAVKAAMKSVAQRVTDD